MANRCGGIIEIKKRCEQDVNRKTHEGAQETFYKGSIFKPYLDTLVSQLQNRFNILDTSATRDLYLLPKNLKSLKLDIKSDTINYYGADLTNTRAVYNSPSVITHPSIFALVALFLYTLK